MPARYPVLWCEQPPLTYAGSLLLGVEGFTLDGTADGTREVLEVPYADVGRVHTAARRSERVRGRPTLLVELPARTLRIATVTGAGVLSEVADALTRAMPVA